MEICKLDVVKLLFDLGVDPNLLSHKQHSLIMVVSQKENFSVLRYLLNHPKINLNYIGPDGHNLIFAAVFFPNAMRLILKHKEKIKIFDKHLIAPSLTAMIKPMHMAVVHQKTESVRMLIKAGVSVNQIWEGHHIITMSLAQDDDATALAMIKAPDLDLSFKDSHGRTIFMNACLFGKTAVVRKLLKIIRSTDLSVRDIHKNSALDLAVINNHSEISRKLIPKYRRIIDRPNKEGKTLLHHAIQNDNLEIVQSLLEACANPYFVSPKCPVSAIDFAIEKSNPIIIEALLTQRLNPKALEYAIKLRNPDLIKKLLDKGHDPNIAIDTEGHTGIMKAILLKNQKAIDIFLGTKLNFFQKSKDNQTLVFLACRYKLNALALYFIKKGCLLHTVVTGTSCFKGMSAIHIAAMNGMKEVVLEILKLHPNFIDQKNIADKDKTPLHYAIQYEKKEIVETLLSLGCDTSSTVLHQNKFFPYLYGEISHLLFQHLYKVDQSEFEKETERIHQNWPELKIQDFLEIILQNKEKAEPIRQLAKSHLGISIKQAIKTHSTTILAMEKLLNYSRFEAAYVLNRYIRNKVLVHIRESDREKTFLEKKLKLLRYIEEKISLEKKGVLQEIVNLVLTNSLEFSLCSSLFGPSTPSFYAERVYNAIQSFATSSTLLLKK